MDQKSKRYFLNFGPELLKLLGPNLYTNIYYVLSEIIANSYDADAENVYILYDNTNTIVIEDDGNGMTYEQVNSKFLPVGVQSRVDEESSYSERFKRRRMGRKGIGKLAALSVSSSVRIQTKRDGDVSGCILSLDGQVKTSEGKYEIPAIDESEIRFYKVTGTHGSSIVMQDSKYSLNKTLGSVKRNISAIFPISDPNFKIHIENLSTGSSAIIENNALELITLADTLITYVDEGSFIKDQLYKLHDHFVTDRYYKLLQQSIPSEKLPKKAELNIKQTSIRSKLHQLKTRSGELKDFDLVIYGWIATYAASKSKQKDSDFYPNHVSILSNGKVGLYDILPEISTNRVGESYIFGQFHVDLLEETELPDIAASNRQGYIEDDPRYIMTREEIKKIVNKVINLKTEATKEKNYLKTLEKEKQVEHDKEEYDTAMQLLTEDPEFKKVISESAPIKALLAESWKLKVELENSYKKVLLSHCGESKPLVDEMEKVLHFCGFASDEIVYTSSDYIESTIGVYDNIYTYLQKFFVNTMLRNDLCVIYILNEQFNKKWAPTLEAGAGWVIKTTSYVFFTDDWRNILPPFSNQENAPKLNFGMDYREKQKFAQAVYSICQKVGKTEKNYNEILNYVQHSTKL